MLPDITRGDHHAEQRYFPRWKINKRAQYQIEPNHEQKEARIVDLSCSGACLVSEEVLFPHQKLKLNIYLNDATAVTVSGRIIWTNRWFQRNEAGIQFDPINYKTQDLILDHAFDLRKEDLVKYWFKGWND